MSAEIIFRLIDFFLAKDSPYCKSSENRFEVGTKTLSPLFSPLVATIANITMHCYTDKWQEKDLKKGKFPPYYTEGKVK